MKTPNGIEIDVGKREDIIDDGWYLYNCTYTTPDGVEHIGSIEGDGEEFEKDTLRDENGDLVEVYQ